MTGGDPFPNSSGSIIPHRRGLGANEEESRRRRRGLARTLRLIEQEEDDERRKKVGETTTEAIIAEAGRQLGQCYESTIGRW